MIQITLEPEVERAVEEEVRAGRSATTQEYVDRAVRERLEVDRALAAHYHRLAQAVLDEDEFYEVGEDWRAGIRRLAQERRDQQRQGAKTPRPTQQGCHTRSHIIPTIGSLKYFLTSTSDSWSALAPC